MRACGWKLKGMTASVAGHCLRTLRRLRHSQLVISAASKPSMNGIATQTTGLCTVSMPCLTSLLFGMAVMSDRSH